MDLGIILDVETTGLDPETCEIIEIGLVEFGMLSDGSSAILETYGGLEEPAGSISEEITSITGITDEQVKGRRIDWEYVRSKLENASIVIAHNAPFDRSFIERRPELSSLNLHWGCSQRHINWSKHKIKTRALNYIAADMGFVNPFAHRAVFDCATTYRVIEPYIQELIGRSYESMFLVKAVGAAFEKKDILKANQYRWLADQRVWAKEVFEGDLDAERLFLESEVYGTQSRHEEMLIS
jgi:DNA polymerase-3 subunit epsilon